MSGNIPRKLVLGDVIGEHVRRILLALTVSALVASVAAQPSSAAPGGSKNDAIISAAWLEQQLNREDLVILDVRSAAEYDAGHIPSSINIPFDAMGSAWTVTRNDLIMEMPEKEDLFTVLGSAGITKRSRVVLVTTVDAPGEPPYSLAAATRVGVTLSSLGVRNLSILDGGYPGWQAGGRATTTAQTAITSRPFNGRVNESLFVDTAYVSSRIGKSIIIDARDAAVYNGEITEPWAAKAGHIPSAISLPAPLMWNADGTYKSEADLARLVTTAIGSAARFDEIIVYCGVGGYASAWTYVLTEVLGYKNVKMYDGSSQAWSLEHDMEM